MTLSDGELLLEVAERKEFVGGIELLIVLAVAALDVTVVP